MKIGIITYHRTLNYGACLQALATRLVLESLGHEVYYVDYWPDYHKSMYQPFSSKRFKKYNIKGKLVYLLTFWFDIPYYIKRQRSFSAFMKKHIFPYCKPLSEPYDIVVYGSDQIWRLQPSTDSFNPFYFAKNDIVAKHHVSFSASMGELPSDYNSKLELKQLLSNFDKIAVREENLLTLVKELGYLDAIKTLDPTLLVPIKEWNRIFPYYKFDKKKYILVYILWGEVFNLHVIEKYAQENNMLVKIIRANITKLDKGNVITTAGPELFIDLVRNAEYVFTSSFHGLVFSLLYNKQFYASFSRNGERASSLLKDVGLLDRMIENNVSVNIGASLINYNIVNRKLEDAKINSNEYLSSLSNF